MSKLSKEEKFVRDELAKIYPQLLINERKILGRAYDRYKGDVMHTAIEMFLEKPIYQQLYTIESGKLENFITFIANVQAKNDTTKFYKQFRKLQETTRDISYREIEIAEEDEEDDEPTYDKKMYDCIMKVYETLNPFEKMIVNDKWMMGLSHSELEYRYGIKSRELTYHTHKLKKKILSICNRQK